MRNPYDDYDAIDPFDDGDETDKFGRTVVRREFEPEEGNFDYVPDEDDYAYAREDRSYEALPYDRVPESGRSADSFPKTMVRKRIAPAQQAEAYRADTRLRREPARRGRLNARRGAVQGQRDPLESRYLDYPGEPSGHEARPAYPQPPQAVAPREKVRRAPRMRRRRSHGCLVTLIIAVVLVVGAYWAVAHPIDDRLAFAPEEGRSVNGTLSWSVPGMPYYVLALGSDAQEGTTGARSDTMILIRIDFWGGKLTMLSIPRDTMVELDGYGRQKINAAYAFEGPGGSVRAVSKLCGVGINHVAVVHINELADLVDFLGGVTVNVPEAAYDPDHTFIDIGAGTQTLDGPTAVAWARTRYGYERGDFQRQEDQRILMEAIMNRMLSLSPREVPGALECVGDLIGTDLRCYDLVPLFLKLELQEERH